MQFLVLVRGRRFQADSEEGVLVGFYAARVVEAPSAAEVDSAQVFAGIRRELAASGVVPTDSAILEIADVEKRALRYEQLPTGFTFFPEESWPVRWIRKQLRRVRKVH